MSKSVPPILVGKPPIAPKSNVEQFETGGADEPEPKEQLRALFAVTGAFAFVRLTDTFLINEGRIVVEESTTLVSKASGLEVVSFKSKGSKKIFASPAQLVLGFGTVRE